MRDLTLETIAYQGALEALRQIPEDNMHREDAERELRMARASMQLAWLEHQLALS